MGDARSGPGRFVVMGCSALSMSPEALVFSFATRAFFYPSQQDCGVIADQSAALGQRSDGPEWKHPYALSAFIFSTRSLIWRDIAVAVSCTRWPWPGSTHSKLNWASRRIDSVCLAHEYQQ
jgi:hypothetical protein